LKTIRDLVAGAISFKAERGDQLIVETLPFDATLHSEPPAPPAAGPAPPPSPSRLPARWRDPKMLGGAPAGALLLLVLMVWAWRRMRRGRAAGAPEVRGALKATPGAPALAGGELEKTIENQMADQAQLQSRLEAEALNAIKVPNAASNKKDALSKYLRESLKKDPVPHLQTLRTWLNEKA
jgi:flagellar biosynthesis/type III secretory pathway M-ring protein FliF/YscJ